MGEPALGAFSWTVTFTADSFTSTTCALPTLTVVHESLQPAAQGTTLGSAATLAASAFACFESAATGLARSTVASFRPSRQRSLHTSQLERTVTGRPPAGSTDGSFTSTDSVTLPS